MGIKEKKLLIISNFINSESARLFLENKGRSIFYFFKKSSEESFVNKLNDFFNKHIDNSKDKNFDEDLKKILDKYEQDPKCSDKIKGLRIALAQDKNDKTQDNIKQMSKFNIRDLSKQLKVILQKLKKLKQVIPIFNSQSVTKRTYVILMNIYNDIDSALKTEPKDSSRVISDSLDDIETLIPKAISSRLIKKSKHLEDKSKINNALSDVYESFSQLKKILFGSFLQKLDSQVNSSITSNDSIANKPREIDIARLGYYVEIIDSDIPKLKKYIKAIDSDIPRFKKYEEKSEKYKNTISSFYDQLKNYKGKLSLKYDSLQKKWFEIKPSLDGKIKENIEKNIKNNKIDIILSDIVDRISKGLIEKSKLSEDKNKINEALSDVYEGFSQLKKILSSSSPEEIINQIKNSTEPKKSSKNASQEIDIEKLGYYIEIIESDVPKLEKYIKNIDSYIKSLEKFEESLNKSKKADLDLYNQLKKYWLELKPNFDIKIVQNINNSKSSKELEGKLSEVINHLAKMRDTFKLENADKWKMLPESPEFIDNFNESAHIITNLVNEISEISQLLFSSHSKKQAISVEKLNKSIDLEEVTNNIEKISVKDLNTQEINKSLSGPANKQLDNKFKYDNSTDNELVNSAQKEKNDIENKLKLNEKDLNENRTVDNKFPCIEDYEQKRKKYLKSQDNESKSICSIILFDFDFLYDAINKTFYDFNHYGYEKTYGGPYSVYNRLYSLLNTSLKDLKTSIPDDSLKDFFSSNDDKIYSLIDYLISIETEGKNCAQEISTLKEKVEEYNAKYRDSYKQNVANSESMYEFATKFLQQYFCSDIQISINSIKKLIDFKENQLIENIFIGDSCERKKILEKIQKEDNTNSNIKLNYICELISYDIKEFENLKNGKNVPAPPKGWMKWGWDLIAGAEEYPKLSFIKLIFSELYNNINNNNNIKQIDKFLKKKTYEFSDVKEILNICSELLKILNAFDINKVDKKLENQKKVEELKKIEDLINNLIIITKNDVEACLECVNKIKTNYDKEKYNSLFENPDRKTLISAFEKTNDLDEKLLTLIKIAVLDVNILNSQTSSVFYKYLPSFIVGNDDVKNIVNKYYNEILNKTKNIRECSLVPEKQFYLNDVEFISKEVDNVISLIGIDKYKNLVKNESNEDLKIFFINILGLIRNDFFQIKKFIEIIKSQYKNQLEKRPSEPKDKLNEFKQARNSILMEYNNLKSPDSRILTLSKLVYNDFVQISKFGKYGEYILAQMGISYSRWFDFAKNEKLTLNIVRENLNSLYSDLVKIKNYLEKLDKNSKVYQALMLLEKDMNLFKDRVDDWITINSKSYNIAKHEVLSDINALHKEAFSDTAIDSGEKILVNYTGDAIKGNVMFSGFLLEYASLEDSELNKNYIEKKSKGKLVVASKLKKAGMRGIKIIATAENLGIGNKSPGIDNSYSVAKVSEVNIKVKFFKKDIKVRVYIAYNKKTIDYPININKIKNNLRAGALQLKSCSSSKSDLNIDEKEDSNIEDYKKYLSTLETLKKLISKEKNKKIKQKLMKIVKSLSDLDDGTSADIVDYIEALSEGKSYALLANDSSMYNLPDNDEINIFDYLRILLTGEKISDINQKTSFIKNMATDAAKEAMKGAAVGLLGGVSGAVSGAIVGGVKGAWNYVFGSSTQKENELQNVKKINPSKIMKGNVCACTAIKSSVVEENDQYSISEESRLNPGYIWTTVDGTSKVVSKILEKFGTANIPKQITKNDKIACISDLTISAVQTKQSGIKKVMDIFEGLTEFNVRVRLYLTLGSISSFLARNFVDIKLETPRGDIEIN